MAKITDYPKVTELVQNNVLLLDGENGTKGILAGDLGKALLSLMTTKEIMNNINIADLDAVSTLETGNSLLVRTTAGNKKISVSDVVFAMLDPVISVEMRRNLWRGKKLGSAVTSTQYNEIDAGTFKGIFLGDYWEIGGRIWRIVDFDYWFGCGDTNCMTHHLVIMPDFPLYKANMNDESTTVGAYVGSKMYTTNLTEAKTIVNGAFTAAHILNHREYLQNAVTDGHPSAGAWFDSTVELPNEIMMYGSYINSSGGNGSVAVNRYTINKTQLAGMKAFPYLLVLNDGLQWLRDVVSNTRFAYISGTSGIASSHAAETAMDVRVVFGIKK